MSIRPLFTLDNRLKACAGMVPPGAKLADIGTDHAYLPVWLVRSQKIEQALACDLRPGPLERAKQNVRRYQVEDKIECRLSDGLDAVAPEEADVIAIAGMGGELIARILQRAPWVKEDKLLILQPMTAAEQLRRFLCGAGYALLQEQAVCADGKPYTVMCARYHGAPRQQDPLYPYIGLLGDTPQQDASAGACYIRKVIRDLENRRRGLIVQENQTEAEYLLAVVERLRAMLPEQEGING